MLWRIAGERIVLRSGAAYSMNEIAIHWNAPLVFLLAAVNAG